MTGPQFWILVWVSLAAAFLLRAGWQIVTGGGTDIPLLWFVVCLISARLTAAEAKVDRLDR